jgi:hypothetical protein
LEENPKEGVEGLVTLIGITGLNVVGTTISSPLLLLRKYLPKREFLKDLTYGLLTSVPPWFALDYALYLHDLQEGFPHEWWGTALGVTFPILGASIKTGLRNLSKKVKKLINK